MADNRKEATTAALLMALLCPGFGIIKLFTLKIEEVTAGKMLQVTLEGNDISAAGFQRLMNQIIVEVEMGGAVQPINAIWVPATVAHKASQEQIEPAQAVNGKVIDRG